MFPRLLPALLALLWMGNALAQHIQPELSLKDAVDRAQAETHGQILTASTVGHGRLYIHRIKVLLPNGHIRTLSLSTPASKSGESPHTMDASHEHAPNS
ncbi:PepSY domain-containing protein [Frateuria aurantia]